MLAPATFGPGGRRSRFTDWAAGAGALGEVTDRAARMLAPATSGLVFAGRDSPSGPQGLGPWVRSLIGGADVGPSYIWPGVRGSRFTDLGLLAALGPLTTEAQRNTQGHRGICVGRPAGHCKRAPSSIPEQC